MSSRLQKYAGVTRKIAAHQNTSITRRDNKVKMERDGKDGRTRLTNQSKLVPITWGAQESALPSVACGLLVSVTFALRSAGEFYPAYTLSLGSIRSVWSFPSSRSVDHKK
ncbi:hypothetical protein RRG08_012599 [Elysia crispata]|uniref:Uncharacterized protein n=1 Tax=Elysia crispata TaxID=231223 RepID=A0AAE1AJ33_9GAST|nr:hypothetical protein RRG08_012599 [Elysia crispata]